MASPREFYLPLVAWLKMLKDVTFLVFVTDLLTTNLSLQQIMKDRWINAGHEDDELKPFVEPELDISDQKRIGKHWRMPTHF